jgi:hypothetical protein
MAFSFLSRAQNFPLVKDECEDFLQNVSNPKQIRERLADLGCVPSLVKASVKNHGFFEALANLSRSESLHIVLQDAGLLQAVTRQAGQDLPTAVSENIMLQSMSCCRFSHR